MALWSKQFSKTIIDFFFPAYCIGCGKEGGFLCDNCCRNLPRIQSPYCDRCGKPEVSGTLCSICWGWKANIDGIRSPFRFDGIIRQAVHELKYHNLKAITECLAEFLFSYLEGNQIPVDVLVPVPLHKKRLRKRGYNQSSLIAKRLGRLATLPVIDDCLVRSKDSQPQTRTNAVNERQANVSDAFVCSDNRLKGKQVLLIDDVCTSGATLEACAVAAKAVGVSSVWGLTLAREA